MGDRKEQKITLSQISGLEDDPKSSSGVFVETDVEKLNALASSAKNDKALAEKSAELKRLREGLLQSRRAVNVAPGSLAEQVGCFHLIRKISPWGSTLFFYFINFTCILLYLCS